LQTGERKSLTKIEIRETGNRDTPFEKRIRLRKIPVRKRVKMYLEIEFDRRFY